MPLLKALSQIELVSSRGIMFGHMFPFLIAQCSYAMLMDALQIYDVTKYLEDHPGGADVLLEVTGKDGTEEFDDAGHSKDAKELMKDYFIGELDLDKTPDIPELEVYMKEQDMDFASKLLANAGQYWAIPVAAVGISAVVAILYARKK
ncbi:hypothetical protein QYE76_015470 [Lolium multiflorum]|uniref:Cytochrome b5 heme-binding domain-containing protein n=1 Tax=Lolium multiflorum TaxID=4521 RepID=A0AAD8U6W4_LOLMU|nr:hypothetical protein QYE76_015470 [Lolium multiflorum]